MSNKTTVLALDLSLNCTGWAVVSLEQGSDKVTVVDKGTINNKNFTKRSQAFRLHRIFKDLRQIFLDHEIDQVVKERGFSRGNVSTQALFKVAGVADVVSYGSGFDDIIEYPPITIKKEVGGHGKASKDEVAEGVLEYLSEPIVFATDDESDAVAVALCYFIKEQLLP